MNIIEDMHTKILEAKAKWPQWVTDPVHASAILSEEAGEVTKAMLDWTYSSGTKEHVIHETLQTMAMCYRILENIDNMIPEKKNE